MHPIDEILSARARHPAMAQVLVVDSTSGSCVVRLADGPVDARLADHMMLPGPTAAVEVGDVVALLPIGDTYLIIASVGSVAGAGGTAPSLGPNLLPNPSFEYGAEAAHEHWSSWPWLTDESSSIRDVTPGEAHSGTSRALQSMPAGRDFNYVSTWTHQAVMVDPGGTYRFSAWLKASEVAPDLQCSLQVISGADADATHPFALGGVQTNVTTLTSPGLTWQMIWGDITIPADHGFARMFLRSNSDHPTALLVSWDDVAFQQRITSESARTP